MISLPENYNYVAAFLTLGCNFRCSYCINHPEAPLHPRGLIGASDWLAYINSINLPADLPVTLQGGEPSQHPEFFELLEGLRQDLRVDLLTNLSFDVEQLAARIPAARFARPAPYPSIRVTYHPGQSNLEETLFKCAYLTKRGYSIGLYSIRVPGHDKLIARVGARAKECGVEHRTKEYLGLWRGQVHGTYHYPEGVFSAEKTVACRTTELLMAPDGAVFRCHRDLYQNENRIGRILGPEPYRPDHRFRPCQHFGQCNPCDLKRKTNRFQIGGHASVEIKFEPAYA